MAITSMNTGLAAGGLVLAAQQGRMRNVAAVSRWLGGYKTKGLAATVYVNSRLGSDDILQGSGSEVAPFKTLGAAVDAMGHVKTQDGYEQFRTLVVQGGVHDVSDIELPMGRWIIVLQGGAELEGSLGFELLAAEAFTSTLPPGVCIINDDASPGIATWDVVTFTQGAGVAVTDAFVYSRGCAIDSVVAAPATVTTVSVELERCSVGECLETDADLVLINCAVSRDLSVATLQTNWCILAGDVTVTGAGNDLVATRLNGAGTFTGPAASFVVDGRTNYWFITNGWALAGGATKVVADDLTP